MRSQRGRSATVASRRALLLWAAAAAGAIASRALWARGLPFFPSPDRELTVPVPGGHVYVRINGRLEGSAPPLMLIHDGPGGTFVSLLNALALADERAVIFYDQLDSGRSDHPNDPRNWTVERFVDEVDAVRRALGLNRWHVFGHGWGATIALEYGARRPPELAGLVLASPFISARSFVADATALRRTLPADLQRVLDVCDPPNSVPIARRRRPQAGECEGAFEAYKATFDRREPSTAAELASLLLAPDAVFNRGLHNAMWGSNELAPTGTLSNYDGEPLLLKLNGASTLLMGGEYDRVRPETLVRFAERLPHAQFAVIRQAAHEFLSDNPKEAVETLRSWLWTQE